MADFFGKLFGGDKPANGAPTGAQRPAAPTSAPRPGVPAGVPRPAGAGMSGMPPRPAGAAGGSPAVRLTPAGGMPAGTPRPAGSGMGAPRPAPIGGGSMSGAASRPTPRPPSPSSFNSPTPLTPGEPIGSSVIDGKSNEDITVEDLLRLIVEKNGSDLHITVGSPPMLRLQGKLWPTDLPALGPKDVQKMLYNFLSNDERAKLERDLELDMSYELKEVSRYRCNIFYSRLGLGAVFRVIPTRIKTLAELRLPTVLSDLARRNKGLILVTGPTGSGKSTTLAAMVDQINSERQDHILTIEDPIEFVHQHRGCIVNQREIGPNTKSFANALRSALREDPDIILVGEMRDYETISLAVTAAETGHLVFATLHTPSAAQSVDRIVDVFPSHQQSQIRTQLADALQGIIAQQLIPTIDGQGRAVALEIMINTSAVANLIRDNKTYQILSTMQTSKQVGMQTMDQSLMDLVKQRKISPTEAYRRAFDKKAFEQYKPKDF